MLTIVFLHIMISAAWWKKFGIRKPKEILQSSLLKWSSNSICEDEQWAAWWKKLTYIDANNGHYDLHSESFLLSLRKISFLQSGICDVKLSTWNVPWISYICMATNAQFKFNIMPTTIAGHRSICVVTLRIVDSLYWSSNVKSSILCH